MIVRPNRLDWRVEQLAKSIQPKLVTCFADGQVQNICGLKPDLVQYPRANRGLHRAGGLQLNGQTHLHYGSHFGFGRASAMTAIILGVTLPVFGDGINGGFVKVGATGDGIGIGAGFNTFDSAGNRLVGLFENVAWWNTGRTYPDGFNIVTLVSRQTGDADWLIRINGEDTYYQATSTAIGPSAETYIGGYTGGGGENRHAGRCTLHFVMIGDTFSQAHFADPQIGEINPKINSLFPEAGRGGLWSSRGVGKRRTFNSVSAGGGGGPNLLSLLGVG